MVTLLAACTSSGIDLSAEREALMEADRAFARATAARGVEGWLEYHLVDGRNIPESGPVIQGHAAIRERWTPLLSDDRLDFTWDPVYADVGSGGDLGYTYGNWTITDTAADTIQSRGRYLTVWRKHADGSWKVTTDIGNTDPN